MTKNSIIATLIFMDVYKVYSQGLTKWLDKVIIKPYSTGTRTGTQEKEIPEFLQTF